MTSEWRCARRLRRKTLTVAEEGSGEQRQYEKEEQQGAQIPSKPVTPPAVCQFHFAAFRLQVAPPSIGLLITQEETQERSATAPPGSRRVLDLQRLKELQLQVPSGFEMFFTTDARGGSVARQPRNSRFSRRTSDCRTDAGGVATVRAHRGPFVTSQRSKFPEELNKGSFQAERRRDETQNVLTSINFLK